MNKTYSYLWMLKENAYKWLNERRKNDNKSCIFLVKLSLMLSLVLSTLTGKYQFPFLLGICS